MLHLLAELYGAVLDRVRSRAKQVKELYNGLPFAHAVMDLWTERHSRVSYGSIVLRFVDPVTTTMEVMPLGISVFRGKHTNDTILRWFTSRLQYFGLGLEDLGSTTTDSGANVRKAMRRLVAPWMPCMSHSLHNTVLDALGETKEAVGGVHDVDDEARGHDNELPTRSSPTPTMANRRRPRRRSRNPGAKMLLSRVRKLLGHFNHSDSSVSSLRNLSVPGDETYRSIVPDVATRWTSTHDALARLYTLYLRLAAFFNSVDASARARKHRLTSDDWNVLRQVLGVLRGAMEVTIRSQSGTDPVSVAFGAMCALRRFVFADSFLVPCPPGPALATGKNAMQAYCQEHPGELVIDVDNRLYHAERRHVHAGAGRDVLCIEASQALFVMRQKMDERFFNAQDETKNLLKAAPVLVSTLLSPGGSKIFKAIGLMLGDTGLCDRALVEVRLLCDRLAQPAVPAADNAPPPTSAVPSPARWSCLTDFMDEEDTRDAPPVRDTKAAIAKAELHECMSVAASAKPGDPLAFWRTHRGRFSTLHLVACAALGAVGSSAASERDFSQAGSIMRKERSCMLAQHLEMHCLIKDNAGL
eukprot:contig_17879_g4385